MQGGALQQRQRWIGVLDGWDDDLYAEESFQTDISALRLPAQAATYRGAPSKAGELLRRASLAAQREREDHAEDGLLAEVGAGDAMDSTPAGVDLAPVQPFAELADEPMPAASTKCGALGDSRPPAAGDADVREWATKAPKTYSRAFSFRASLRGGLVALPVVDPSSGGTFRVRLLRLDPSALCSEVGARREEEEDTPPTVCSGSELLEAQVQVGFATPSASAKQPNRLKESSVPQLLVPAGCSAKALLEQYVELGVGALGEHAHDAFTLLRALSRDGADQRSMLTWPSSEPTSVRQAARQLSGWLSRVNSRSVRALLARGSGRPDVPKLMELGGGGGRGAESKWLDAVYHHLTANCVPGALRALNNAAVTSAAGSRVHFDRLGAIIASCGGTSMPCVERRHWLRRQLEEWREQGVNQLMGPALWRIYSLLAGDIEDVVAESPSWLSGFGMFLWYRCPTENSREGEHAELRRMVCDFEACVARHGSSCSFRPLPPHACGRGASNASSSLSLMRTEDAVEEARDLRFNIIRAALGLVERSDCKFFDYATCSARPMDVACSWHCAVLLLTLCGGETGSESFQLLTQQYCLLLELSGLWEWAVYVALFIQDAPARGRVVRRLMQRHLKVPNGEDLQPAIQPHLAEGRVPAAWFWRVQALRSEAAEDWAAAVSCWLQCGGGKRAAVLAVGFLQGWTLLGHTAGPAVQEPLASPALAPMSPPALWLLKTLEEVGPAASCFHEAWAETAREALAFMRDWERHAGPGPFTPSGVDLAEFYGRCNRLRRHLLGVPWQ